MTEKKAELFALCSYDGKFLYVTPDLIGRFHRSLDGACITDLLDEVDRIRFDRFRLEREERTSFVLHGVRGLGACMVERIHKTLGPSFRCYFARTLGDLPADSRTLRADFFRTARRSFDAARRTASEQLAEETADPRLLGAAVEEMYKSSMLLLLSTEMFFGRREEKFMKPVIPALREITDCLLATVRHVDLDVEIHGEPYTAATYEDASFALFYLTLLSIANDVTLSHRVGVTAEDTMDGAYLTLRTEARLSCPEFALRPIGHMVHVLPETLRMRAHLCDVISGAYGYGLQCAWEKGTLIFEVDMPHIRRGEMYLKEDPFALHDTEEICRPYIRYLFPSEDGR